MAVQGKFIKVDRNNAFALIEHSGLMISKFSSSITCLLVMSDNCRFLTGHDSGIINCWCLENYNCIRELKADKKQVIAIHEVVPAKQFITIFNGLEIKVWGNEDFILRFAVTIKLNPICSKMCDYGNIFATLSKFGHISLFSPVNMTKINDYTSDLSNCAVFDISEPKDLIIIGCDNKLSVIYSLYNFKKHREYHHDSSVTTVRIFDKANKFLTGEIEGVICIFDLSSYDKVNTVLINSLNIISLECLKEFDQIVFASGNKTISLVEDTGLNVRTIFSGFKFQIKHAQVLDNRKKIVCSMADGSLQVLDFENGHKLAELYPLYSRIQSVFYNSNDILYTQDLHGNLNVWKISEKRVKNLLTERGLILTSITHTKTRIVLSAQNLRVLVFNIN